jgi:DNA-binding YbaB/EbfC family protein
VAFGNPAKMMQQVQQMQADMARVQEELGAMTIDGTAGGGAVTATATGHGQLVSVTISKDVVDPDDVDMLQDLVTAAVNDALNNVKQVTEEKMSRVTGGLSLPGLL